MKIGYIRVSTKKQNYEVQLDAMKKLGIENIYEEKESGMNNERPVLNELLKFLRSGDVLYIYDLSRLSRGTMMVLKLIEDFNLRDIGLVSIKENLDISSTMGKALVSLISVFNQMQLEISNEKVKAGLASARSRGRIGGRPKISEKTIKQIYTLYDSKNYSIAEIAKNLNISKRSVINYINLRKKGD